MFFGTTYLNSNCKRLFKYNIKYLTKIQRNFVEFKFPHLKKIGIQKIVVETSINIYSFKPETKPEAAAYLLAIRTNTQTTFLSKQIQCQLLVDSRKSLPTTRSIYNTNALNSKSINMVTAEEAVKYLEIPDKSENDKKHYKLAMCIN